MLKSNASRTGQPRLKAPCTISCRSIGHPISSWHWPVNAALSARISNQIEGILGLAIRVLRETPFLPAKSKAFSTLRAMMSIIHVTPGRRGRVIWIVESVPFHPWLAPLASMDSWAVSSSRFWSELMKLASISSVLTMKYRCRGRQIKVSDDNRSVASNTLERMEGISGSCGGDQDCGDRVCTICRSISECPLVSSCWTFWNIDSSWWKSWTLSMLKCGSRGWLYGEMRDCQG